VYKRPYVDPERMKLGEHLPFYVIRVGRGWSELYRQAARAKHKDTRAFNWQRWFYGMVSEAAFYVRLHDLGKWKHWWGTVFFGKKSEAGFDFLTAHRGKIEAIGIRSGNQQEMRKFAEADILTFYPVREPIEIPKYVIATSLEEVQYEGESETSVLVAFWGALRGKDIDRMLRDESKYPHTANYGNRCIIIPLQEWSAELLQQIEESRDIAAPEEFKRLLKRWGCG
jgi:hypothetical protein